MARGGSASELKVRADVRSALPFLPLRRQWRQNIKGWLLISPWFIGFLWFDVIAFILSFYLGFTDISIGTSLPDWVGLANYRRVFTGDHLIGKSFTNTLYYVSFSVPLTMVTAFSLALLLNASIRGRGVFRTIYYLPSLVPIVASSAIWMFMLRTKGGGINQLLGLFGLDPIPWLTRPEWTKPALILMSLWGFGGQMVIYLAGLQAVPEVLYEAADIDGASGWQKLIRVTVPLLTPTIFFNLVMGIIGAFRVFTSAYIMTGVGPLNSTLFYMFHLYNNAFVYYKMGYASAMAILLFLVMLALTLFVHRTSGRWVHYTSA